MGDSHDRFVLKVSKDEDEDEAVAYLRLPEHPGAGTPNCVAKQVRLLDLMSFTGPDVYLDLDEKGRLIGIELLE